ncbi:MAG: molybdenum cofactor guanylyltransferase [Promethearchaeota archaeon]
MVKINTSTNDLAFAVLIGGKSIRFGSVKGIFKFNGKPLIAHVIDTLLPFHKKIFLVAHDKAQATLYKSHLSKLDSISFIFDDMSFIEDETLRTPLLGFYAAFQKLDALHHEKCFILSCDMPFINPNVIQLLIDESHDHDCVIPRWNNGYLEPLFSIYPIEKALSQTQNNLIKKEYKLIKIIEDTWRVKYISIEDKIKAIDGELLTFFNINKFEDIEYLKKYHGITINERETPK